MLHIVVLLGTADTAPTFLRASHGAPAWSGKNVADIGHEDAASILDYAKQEAELAGWWDALETGELADDAGANPFHPAFLGGLPHRTWAIHYQRGAADAMPGRNWRAAIPESVALTV